MKKLFLSLTLILAAMGAVSAQNLLLDDPDNEAYLGVRLGVDITSTSGPSVSTYNNGTGFSLGAIYNIPVWQNLYVEPGLSFFYNTFSEDITTVDKEVPGVFPEDPSTVVSLPYTVNRSIRNFGFRIPILAGYHFDFTDMMSIAVFTGPQLNLSLYAHDHVKKYPEVDTSNMGAGSMFGENGFKHIDLQWVFGASVTYDRYVFSVQGGVGMTKVFNKTYVPGITDKLRRNTCTISVGYNF